MLKVRNIYVSFLEKVTVVSVVIPEICYVLIKYGVSLKFYHKLAMECTELPRYIYNSLCSYMLPVIPRASLHLCS